MRNNDARSTLVHYYIIIVNAYICIRFYVYVRVFRQWLVYNIIYIYCVCVIMSYARPLRPSSRRTRVKTYRPTAVRNLLFAVHLQVPVGRASDLQIIHAGLLHASVQEV